MTFSMSTVNNTLNLFLRG